METAEKLSLEEIRIIEVEKGLKWIKTEPKMNYTEQTDPLPGTFIHFFEDSK